jgi:creatinine amidohydrolase
MSIFHFEELTWPDVAALPRDLPLILPLGAVNQPDQLLDLLGTSLDIGILPFIPFGWAGSGIEVPRAVFNALICNIIGNLIEDGFTNIQLLSTTKLDLPPEIRQLQSASVWLTVPSLVITPENAQKVILIPIGHTEQHGYHAPLSTDTIIIDAIGQGVAKAVPKQAACLPAFPYGVSTHRRSFPGTFNVGGREFEDFWLAVIDALVARGFARFYLMSGHGGNSSFLINVVKYAGEKYPQIFCATSFLYLSGPKGVAALEARRDSSIGGMGHACELETSLVLHLQPKLVHLDRAVDETGFITTPSYYMDWIEGGALVANPPWEDDTRTGAYGAGSLGTAKKGQYWLKVAIEEKVDHVIEIQEQFRRRKERREKRQKEQ